MEQKKNRESENYFMIGENLLQKILDLKVSSLAILCDSSRQLCQSIYCQAPRKFQNEYGGRVKRVEN